VPHGYPEYVVNHNRFPKGIYEKELYRLQAQLVGLQEWIRMGSDRRGHPLRATNVPHAT
jgi:hypothetical protein